MQKDKYFRQNTVQEQLFSAYLCVLIKKISRHVCHFLRSWSNVLKLEHPCPPQLSVKRQTWHGDLNGAVCCRLPHHFTFVANQRDLWVGVSLYSSNHHSRLIHLCLCAIHSPRVRAIGVPKRTNTSYWTHITKMRPVKARLLNNNSPKIFINSVTLVMPGSGFVNSLTIDFHPTPCSKQSLVRNWNTFYRCLEISG